MSSSSPSSSFNVCVVGGGPSGAAVAVALRREGHAVDLYEAYPHPRQKPAQNNNPKAYVIALGPRGQQGLTRATGIRPEQVQGGIRTGNLARHAGGSHPRAKLMQRDQPALIVPRQALAAHLLDEAEKAGVRLHLEHRLVGIDFERRIATFETASKKKVERAYDLLVGCDGSKSAVRTLLDDAAADFSVERTEVDSMEYQVAVLPEQRLFSDKLPADTVHAWNSKEYNAICLAFPVMDKNSTVFVIVFPEGKLTEFQVAHKQKQKDDSSGGDGGGYDKPLASLLPDVDERSRQDLAAQLATAGTPANGGLCVWCRELGSRAFGVALVGDAAHGMWPSLGEWHLVLCAVWGVGLIKAGNDSDTLLRFRLCVRQQVREQTALSKRPPFFARRYEISLPTTRAAIFHLRRNGPVP